jgi:adenylate kinase family enzyme
VERIAVIGCGGAGKTTLANELGRRLSLPVLHVDGFYWQDRPGTDRFESTPEQWHTIHEQMISSKRWVIDGMKLGVLPARLAAADTVIFLDLPPWRCLSGVLKRRLRYRGQLRPDLGVYDHVSREFIDWILSFRRRVRPRILELLDNTGCHVVILTSHREATAFLGALPAPRSEIAA